MEKKAYGTNDSIEEAQEDVRVRSNYHVGPHPLLQLMAIPAPHPFATYRQRQASAAVDALQNMRLMQQYSREYDAIEVALYGMNRSLFTPYSNCSRSLLPSSIGGPYIATHGQPRTLDVFNMDVLSRMMSQRRIVNSEFLLPQHRAQPQVDQDSLQQSLPLLLPRREETVEVLQKNLFTVIFHRALMELEVLPGGSDVAAFLPDGRSFCIKDQEQFEQLVLPVFFPKMKGFPSFQRQLNLYGFQRQAGMGRNRGSYHHHLFHRDYPDWLLAMKRRKVKKSQRSSART
jgi:HSF-type DNA-binding